MLDQVTLIADLDGVVPRMVEFEFRPIDVSDRDALGRLYFESYDPGVACDTEEEAIDDIQASFDGGYGDMVTEASLVVLDDRSLVGAVMTVHRPPWDELPDCPMIIELFVARTHRKQGIGIDLVRRSMAALRADGERQVSLRVDSANEPAVRLYQSLGFRAWP